MDYACYHTSDTLVRMCPFQVLNLLKTLWRIGRTYQRAANIEHTIIYSIQFKLRTWNWHETHANRDICNGSIVFWCIIGNVIRQDVTEFSLTHRSQKLPTAAKKLRIRIANLNLQNNWILLRACTSFISYIHVDNGIWRYILGMYILVISFIFYYILFL